MKCDATRRVALAWLRKRRHPAKHRTLHDVAYSDLQKPVTYKMLRRMEIRSGTILGVLSLDVASEVSILAKLGRCNAARSNQNHKIFFAYTG